MDVAQNRAKAAIPARTATTLPPTATMLAAPLKVVDGVEVDEVLEVIGEDVVEDVIFTNEDEAAGVVELPAGKGTGATGVEVVVGTTGVETTGGATGVEEVEVTGGATGVEEVEVVGGATGVATGVVEVLEVVGAAAGALAIPETPPEHGKVTM